EGAARLNRVRRKRRAGGPERWRKERRARWPRWRRQALLRQQRTRFCSRSTPCFTESEARGYLRLTSPSEAQAASFSPSAASDSLAGRSASGAFAVVSYLVETLRNDSAASRYC